MSPMCCRHHYRPRTDYVRIMPNRGRFNGAAPIDMVAEGEWPEAELDGPEGVLWAAVVTQHASRRLRDEMRRKGYTNRGLAEAAGVSDAVVRRLLAGTAFVDIVSIVRLERFMNKALLPDWRDRRP